MEYNEIRYMKTEEIKFIIEVSEDKDGNRVFGKWINEKQWIRREKLKKIQKLMK